MNATQPLNRAQRRALARPVNPRARVPRPIAVNTLDIVKHKVAALTEAERATLLKPLHDAFGAMRTGVATELDYGLLDGAVAMASHIEAQGVVRGLVGHLKAAQAALDAYKRRSLHTGDWRPNPVYFAEIEALMTFLDVHDFQLSKLSYAEFTQARAAAVRTVVAQGGTTLTPEQLNHNAAMRQEPLL